MVSKILHFILSLSFFGLSYLKTMSQDITFCGEKIPIGDEFVANKLMNVIRKQIPNANLPSLRQDTKRFFPVVEDLLRKTGLPDDLKYVAIVESGFRNVVSPVGAAGFWQLMPTTALELGLTINQYIDDRNDIYKATHAACRILAQYYLSIKKKYSVSSWILAAAAYNIGIGRMSESIREQGTNYFRMQLNAETAEYVYKIIAVKELWEHPELYMQNLGNVFKSKRQEISNKPIEEKIKNEEKVDRSEFTTLSVDINEKDGIHPVDINFQKGLEVEEKAVILPEKKKELKKGNAIWAQIKGDYKNVEDGQVINMELIDDFHFGNLFMRKGNTIRGTAWLIDDRIFIDLGKGRNIILYDSQYNQGIAINSLKNNEPIIIQVYKS